jgi:dCTP deaminase
MAALPDHEISRLVREQCMIEPYIDRQVQEGILSYGVSSYGYDARLARTFKKIKNDDGPLDPKLLTLADYEDVPLGEDGTVEIEPHSFLLGHTIEYFRVPLSVIVLAIGKSTYARCGLNILVTPLEPGWEGQVTLELQNTTNRPILLYPNEGICQFIFFLGAQECERPYTASAAKYQHQTGVVAPRIATTGAWDSARPF